MVLVLFYNVNNFITEQNLLLIILFNFLLSSYVGARIVIGNFIIILAYQVRAISSYIISPIFFSIQGYIIMRDRNELIAARYNTNKGNKKWKSVLDICQEGILILDNKKVAYYNKGFVEIAKSENINHESLLDDVNFNIRIRLID